MLRGCLWTIGIVVGLLVLGWIYLVLNPPFGSTETGYLSRTEEQRLTLSAETPSAAYRVSIDAPERIYANAYDAFEPLAIRATVASEAEADLAVRIYPADELPVSGLVPTADGRSVGWELDCQAPDAEPACPRDYLVVVAVTAPPTDELHAELHVFAEQRFPTYVDTPFMVGLDINLERLDDEVAGGWSFAEGHGTLELSPGAPVAEVVVAALGSSGNEAGGLILSATAERLGGAMPTGLGAPPPIRLALLDVDGQVLADLGVRPGTDAAIAIEPGSGHHRLVAWWQDRADQAYEVSWRLEVAAAGDPELAVSATQQPPTVSIGPPTGESGTLELGGPGGPAQWEPLPLVANIGGVGGPNRLPAMVGVLRLRLLVTGDDRAPVVVRLAPTRESSSGSTEVVPIVLEPGTARDIALAGLPGCTAAYCESWAILPADPYDSSTPARPVHLAWEATLELWPLDPFSAAAR